MKLGLATYPAPKDKPATLESGAIQLPATSTPTKKIIVVVNDETGERVDNVKAFIWGPGGGFSGAIEAPGLFEPRHFEEGVDYVIVAFECEAMIEYDEGPPVHFEKVIELGLATYDLPRDPPQKLESGVTQLPPPQQLGAVKVINNKTGEVIDNIKAWVWGPGENFAGAIEAPGMFDPEHFDEGVDYALIAFPCKGMQICSGPPS